MSRGNVLLEADVVASVIIPRSVITGDDDNSPEIIQIGSNKGVFAVGDTAEEIEEFVMDFLDDGQDARVLLYVKRNKVKARETVPTL